jgi:hypothetical protein
MPLGGLAKEIAKVDAGPINITTLQFSDGGFKELLTRRVDMVDDLGWEVWV